MFWLSPQYTCEFLTTHESDSSTVESGYGYTGLWLKLGLKIRPRRDVAAFAVHLVARKLQVQMLG